MLKTAFLSLAVCLVAFGAEAKFSITEFNEPLAKIPTAKGDLALDVGVGSGGYHLASDPDDVFYTITDRGANIDCKDDLEILGEDFCKKGKIFPIPDFAPTIYKFQLTAEGAKILEKIPLKIGTNPASGISNPQTEISFGIDKNELRYDPDGIDAEAIVVTSKREFYIADEYAPSIAYVSASGEILERFVPKGVGETLKDAKVKTTEILPAKLRDRELNRGFEALALSPDESTLYTALQSPYEGQKDSKIVPFIAINLKDKTIAGEYFYELDGWEKFALDTKKKPRKQNDVKLSEMASLPNGDVIVLERISKSTRLYKISPQNAKSGEVLQKQLVLDSDTLQGLVAKIESLIIATPKLWYLINDNDFGIEGDKTKFIKVEF